MGLPLNHWIDVAGSSRLAGITIRLGRRRLEAAV